MALVPILNREIPVIADEYVSMGFGTGVLAPGGHFVGKLFQGPAFQELVQRCRRGFEVVKIIKPQGSRQQSIEQYVVARGYRGPSRPGAS